MSKNLVTVSSNFFEQVKYSYEAHSPSKMKQIPWMVCRHCGLVYLKNEITAWAIKMGCNNSYHPDYKRLRDSL